MPGNTGNYRDRTNRSRRANMSERETTRRAELDSADKKDRTERTEHRSRAEHADRSRAKSRGSHSTRRSRGSGCLPILIGFLIAIGTAAGIGYHFFGPTSEKADIAEIYKAESTDGVNLYLNYERVLEEGLYSEGEFYLPYRWVIQNLNDRFYYDQETDSVLYTLPEQVLSYGTEDKGSKGQSCIIKGEAGVADINGSRESLWLSLELVGEYTDVSFNRIEDEAKRLFVKTDAEAEKAPVIKKAALRVRGGRRSLVQTVCEKGEEVVVLEKLENWVKVVSDTGFMGYVPKKALGESKETARPVTYTEPVYNPGGHTGKVTLAWHQITNAVGNDTLNSFLQDTHGITVISPTWYVLSDNDGAFISFSSKEYVDNAHSRGIKVWAVIDNFSNEVSSNVQSEVVLSKASARARIIDNLIADVTAKGIDGINLDFEGLKDAAGVHYVQFIRELGIRCREKGIVLSVDDYVPAPFNRFYNIKEQGKMCDYVVIMAYDEHYAGGDEGSVSSISYVRDGISDTLKDVPADKVICGLPVYTRLWNVSGSNVTSQAIGMQTAAAWVKNNNAELEWDDSTGQYYCEKDTSEGIKMMWLEDEKSLELKMDAVKKSGITGVAIWKLNMETPIVWDILSWD